MPIPRVPIYIFDILRHHASMTYAHFLWRTYCPTENGFKASVTLHFQKKCVCQEMRCDHSGPVWTQRILAGNCGKPIIAKLAFFPSKFLLIILQLGEESNLEKKNCIFVASVSPLIQTYFLYRQSFFNETESSAVALDHRSHVPGGILEMLRRFSFPVIQDLYRHWTPLVGHLVEGSRSVLATPVLERRRVCSPQSNACINLFDITRSFCLRCNTPQAYKPSLVFSKVQKVTEF